MRVRGDGSPSLVRLGQAALGGLEGRATARARPSPRSWRRNPRAVRDRESQGPVGRPTDPDPRTPHDPRPGPVAPGDPYRARHQVLAIFRGANAELPAEPAGTRRGSEALDQRFGRTKEDRLSGPGHDIGAVHLVDPVDIQRAGRTVHRMISPGRPAEGVVRRVVPHVGLRFNDAGDQPSAAPPPEQELPQETAGDDRGGGTVEPPRQRAIEELAPVRQ